MKVFETMLIICPEVIAIAFCVFILYAFHIVEKLSNYIFKG